MNNERFPRTLQEAFGPYTSYQVEAAEERRARDNRELWVVSVCSALCGIAGLLIVVLS
jgi:hypothetical protein